MYRKSDRNQLSLEEFMLPFGGHLLAENRWVKTANLMPWEMIEDIYAASFKDKNPDGRIPFSARIAFGALHIKESENFTDERTVESIAENPYMQYFLGLRAFQQEPLFDPSMMTHFRKRFSADDISKINEELFKRMNPPQEPPEGDSNNGTLVLDATAAPSDVRYPTDLSLLNECRENTEKMIDTLWKHSSHKGHKVSYNKKKARSNYLKIQKQRKPRRKALKQTIKRQVAYVEKNIETISALLAAVGYALMTDQQLERLVVICAVCRQQKSMIESNQHSCENRIVNLRQPHVRPIVRGKARAPVEFGQKLAFAVVNGFTFIEKQSWDNFSEGNTLIASAEKYKQRHGVYPEAILADKAYRNRENLTFCKKNGIRLTGPKLGRPKKEESETEKVQAYRDSCARNIVESRNGIAKRRYGLDRIMAYLSYTGETEAALQVFVMNIAHCLRALLHFFEKVKCVILFCLLSRCNQFFS